MMSAVSGVHVRLVVSRGLKSTPYQAPAATLGSATVVVLPEWKTAAPGPRASGIRLFTVHVRRGSPDAQDPGWNSLSKLNCIAACIQVCSCASQCTHACVCVCVCACVHECVRAYVCMHTNEVMLLLPSVWLQPKR
jgi:hypothetical protein